MIEKLIAIQRDMKLNDRQFAERIGISRILWYHIKHGRCRPGAKSIPAILKAFPELVEFVGDVNK